MIKLTSLLTLFVIAAILVSMNTSTSFAQNNALSQSGNSKASQEIEQAQSSAQDSQCVSGDITALSCNNLGIQVQSNGDKDGGEKPPVPPGDKCPNDYVWDVTTTEGGTVPEGTVICLTQGLGNHPATVVEPNEEPYVTDVNANQPNEDPNCNGQGQQSAEVTSGTPPTPLEMGDPLCVKVTPVA